MKMHKSFSAIALLVFLVCLLSANGAAQSPDQIEIRDLSSPPDMLVVPAGTMIIWVNDDSFDHTVTSDDGTFHSGHLAPGEQFRYLFDHPGYYPYHCDAHPSVHGTIHVTSGSYRAASSSSDSYPNAVSADTARSTDSKYSQYDQNQIVSKPNSAAYTTAPQKCEACEMESSSQANPNSYGQKQAQPSSQYQGLAKQSGGNSLWIQGDTDWTQHATAPLGKRLSLMAVSTTEGDGYLYETYPDGQTVKDEHHFFPYSQMDFYADKIGKHLLSFTVNNQASNSVVVDVVDYNTPSDQKISYPQQNYQVQGYQKQNYQQKDYQQQNYQQQNYPQKDYKQNDYSQQNYQQNDYEQKGYKQQNYQQQNYQQQNYQQQNYQQQNYQQPYYNQPSSQPKPAPAAVYPPADYSSFWATSAVKLDSKGYLTMEGIQGADYYLYPSNTNVLTRGLYYNGVSYILIANPNGVPNTVVVNPQMGYWDMQNVQIMYGQPTLAKSANLLQITAPAFQSALIIIKPQKKRYSFTAGPKPASSFRAGPKPAYSSTGGLRQPYSFNAGPKQPYSFRIGY